MHRDDFQNIDRRPARRAGQAETEAIAPIADLDRRDGAQRSARAALLALVLTAAAAAADLGMRSPCAAFACLLALTVAVAGLAGTWRS